MNTIIDYVGAMITGGAVFIMMLSYYLNVGATAVSQIFNTTVQEDMTSITEIIEHDLRKAGYAVTDSVAFPVADTSRIAVRGDFDNNGTIDTVTYWLDNTPMQGHSNPNARMLFRRANGRTVKLTTNGVSLFKTQYFDSAGVSTNTIKNIRFVHVSLNMECRMTYDDRTAGVYWERVFKPQNVR